MVTHIVEDNTAECGEPEQETDHFLQSSENSQKTTDSVDRQNAEGTNAVDDDDADYSFCQQLKVDAAFRGRVIHTVWLCWTFIGLGTVVGQVGPSFPDLRLIVKQELDVGTLIFTIFSLGYMFGSALAGYLYDRWNKLFLIILYVWIMALSSVVLPWCQSFPVMLTLRFITGVGCGGLDTVGNADLVSLWDEAGRPYMQALHFCFGFGGIISPLYTEPFLAKKKCASYSDEGTETTYNISTISPLMNSTSKSTSLSNITDIPSEKCTSWMYEETRIHYAFIITCIFLVLASIPFIMMFINKMRSKRRHSIHANKDNMERPDKLPFILKLCLLVLISAMFLVYCAIEDSFGGFMMTFCLNYLKYDKGKGSLATSLFWACFSFGRFSGIFLIRSFSPITWLFIFCSLMVISLLSFVLSSVYLVYPLVWICTGLVGFACSLMFPCMFTWTEESVLKVTGMISSLFLLASSSGLMINPIFLGSLMDNLTPLWFAYILFGESVLYFTLISLTFFIVKKFVRPLRESETGEIEPETNAIPLSETYGNTLPDNKNV